VTVDPFSRNILVADYDTHRIFQFDGNSGKFLRYALTGGDGCRGPCGVAVGPDCGTMVVTESSADAFGNIATTGAVTQQQQQQFASWPANVKAYRLHEVENAAVFPDAAGARKPAVVEQVWNFKTESTV
jgi:DNA-binding beta-propeller fold protein YncE